MPPARHHLLCRASFCLSAWRRSQLASLTLSLKVCADNGADVWLNGISLLADSANDHEMSYWNNNVAVPGSSAALVAGG